MKTTTVGHITAGCCEGGGVWWGGKGGFSPMVISSGAMKFHNGMNGDEIKC